MFDAVGKWYAGVLGSKKARKNPAKFDRCVRDVTASSKKHGYPLKSAYAVCNAAIRKNVDSWWARPRSNPYPISLAVKAHALAADGRPHEEDGRVFIFAKPKTEKYYREIAKLIANGEAFAVLSTEGTGERVLEFKTDKNMFLGKSIDRWRDTLIALNAYERAFSGSGLKRIQQDAGGHSVRGQISDASSDQIREYVALDYADGSTKSQKEWIALNDYAPGVRRRRLTPAG